MAATTQLVLLTLCWTTYGLIHTLLASHRCKAWCRNRFPAGFRAYRLTFNIVSAVLLVPPLWLMLSYPGETLWHWPPIVRWLADAAALAALIGFAWSMKMYDTGEFLGISQLRQASAALDDQSPMRLSMAHRFVRHPWYFFGLVIIWSREMNAAWLVSAAVLTLYLLVGSRLEEAKLIVVYGEQYRRYRQRVPAFIPRPWRYLRRQEAQDILAMGKQ